MDPWQVELSAASGDGSFFLGIAERSRNLIRVIHPTAIVHPKAELDSTVIVGPCAVIDAAVRIGSHCVVGPHTFITGRTVIGDHNQFFAGAVIGEAPQDLKYAGAPTGVRIGNHNVFREHVTVHRSTNLEQETSIGSHNFLMANSHVGHNSQLGDHIMLANGALLGGHVVVENRAFISGNCVVHQFVRIGSLALMQGGAGLSKDLLPYTIARGINTICGLNIVGLRRAGLKPDERLELKRLYRFLFREGRTLRLAISEARKSFSSEASKLMLDFADASKRGLCAERGKEDSDQSTFTH